LEVSCFNVSEKKKIFLNDLMWNTEQYYSNV